MDDISGQKRFRIIVKTNAKKNEILGFDDEKKGYRLNIKAIPEKGKANAEIIRFLSKKLKKKVRIKSGFASKEKVIDLT